MIIAFTGYKRSGKSTASRYVLSKLPGAVQLNFKTALLEEMKERFPKTLSALVRLVEREQYDGTNPLTVERFLEEKPDEVARFFLQEYGTEVRRHDDPDYWVVKWLKKATRLQHVVVDDLRFLNEYQVVKDIGGVVIRIIRNGQVSTDGHRSETEMEHITPDITIVVPDGTPEYMYPFLDNVIRNHKTP